jgi:hypothetical protein
MQTVHLVVKEIYNSPLANSPDHRPVKAFATAEAAEEHAKMLNEQARTNSWNELYYEVETVQFENL